MPSYSGVWTLSQQFQGRGQGLWPQLPGAPTIGTASQASATSVAVAFTAPACAGVPATITGYTATSTPGCFTGTGTASPVTVSGLTTGTAYTFKVKAQNNAGFGPCSASSNSVTPVAQGQQAFTTAGTFSWVAPAGVTSVSVVAVGGGGGSGGGLGYKNNISVTPGSSYAVVVGVGGQMYQLAGGTSSFINTSTVAGNGGPSNGNGGGFVGDGGGSGGYANYYSGGGAGGYAGGTGLINGAGSVGTSSFAGGNAGTGGGGGGGSWDEGCFGGSGGAGGGVGILGQGASGSGGQFTGRVAATGGSGGASAGAWGCFGPASAGGAYGGGGAFINFCNPCFGGNTSYGLGAGGAVRIIWPGTTRSFPSTNTGNL